MSVTVNIRGIPVEFPFQPYDIQIDYMEKVIKCIENRSVAFLESPTGTGKTLSLLCSSLAWLQLNKDDVETQQELSVDTDMFKDDAPQEEKIRSQIIYASRTHSQLDQAVQEMKKISYKQMKARVLASRDHLCIHPEVLAEPENSMKKLMCKIKVARQTCHYKNRVERMNKHPELCNAPIVDIEDMVSLGRKHSFCPYFMTKLQIAKADIIFTPYNYLVDPLLNTLSDLRLKNSVIIFDEGHNVAKFCEEAASIDIKSSDLTRTIAEITYVMDAIQDRQLLSEESGKESISSQRLEELKFMLIQFERALDNIVLNTTGNKLTYFPGDFIFEMLEKAQISSANYCEIACFISNIITYLAAQRVAFAPKGAALQHFLDFLKLVFGSKASRDEIQHCYTVHIKEEEQELVGNSRARTRRKKWPTKKKSRVLNFWCFSPRFSMNRVMSRGIRGLILTSGTLAPMMPLISELELDVRICLENPHIVKENQVCIQILPKGPDDEPLNSSYRNRDNTKYVTSLGRTIVNLSRIIPDGLLIFFPSYPVMQQCQSRWEAKGIWGDIESQKAIFVEPRGKDDFGVAMTGYYRTIQDPNTKGAIFMAVCRGKVSEGLDFIDANGRAVIITGLPYPALREPRVILKRQYLDSAYSREKGLLTGNYWYSLEATRTVNQAVGRVIRHRYDYGAILLLDERFNGVEVRGQMSKWLREHTKVVTKYGEVIRHVSQFFRKARVQLPTPELNPDLAALMPKPVPTSEFEPAATRRRRKRKRNSRRNNRFSKKSQVEVKLPSPELNSNGSTLMFEPVPTPELKPDLATLVLKPIPISQLKPNVATLKLEPVLTPELKPDVATLMLEPVISPELKPDVATLMFEPVPTPELKPDLATLVLKPIPISQLKPNVATLKLEPVLTPELKPDVATLKLQTELKPDVASLVHEPVLTPELKPDVATLMLEPVISPELKPDVTTLMLQPLITPKLKPDLTTLLFEPVITPELKPDVASLVLKPVPTAELKPNVATLMLEPVIPPERKPDVATLMLEPVISPELKPDVATLMFEPVPTPELKPDLATLVLKPIPTSQLKPNVATLKLEPVLTPELKPDVASLVLKPVPTAELKPDVSTYNLKSDVATLMLEPVLTPELKPDVATLLHEPVSIHNLKSDVATPELKLEPASIQLTSGRKRIFRMTNKLPSREVDKSILKMTMKEFVLMIKSDLDASSFEEFTNQLKVYRATKDIGALIEGIDPLVPQHLRYILIRLDTFLSGSNRVVYRDFLGKNNLFVNEQDL